uniref:CSON002865 protein n=1 Tax=Culicoides sonorensis TaxID=179676 RepID=A0A336MPS4_CULSO
MAFLWRRRLFLLKFVIVGAIVWIALIFILFSDESRNESSITDTNNPFDEFLIDSHKDVNVNKFVHFEYNDYDSKTDNKKKEKQQIFKHNSSRDKYEHNKITQSLQKPGEMGRPVILPTELSKEIKQLVDEGWTKNAFNEYVSNMISVHRELPDPRDEWCKVPGRFINNLPSTSIIICFHNEAWSVLLRTVHSVLDRSPSSLIKEVILVDDFSDLPHLQEPLENYFANNSKIKILRAKKREGLIRARLLGARKAKGEVLTYLDSHCECTKGWLEPLLDRIARNRTTVVCPVIDVIDDTTLEYHFRDSVPLGSGIVKKQ